ncbi:hypothetical protein ACOME3_000625 [Neoechinorhynchus agilis]
MEFKKLFCKKTGSTPRVSNVYYTDSTTFNGPRSRRCNRFSISNSMRKRLSRLFNNRRTHASTYSDESNHPSTENTSFGYLHVCADYDNYVRMYSPFSRQSLILQPIQFAPFHHLREIENPRCFEESATQTQE